MRKQQGMTLIGMLFTAVVVVMAGIFVMRVVPVYIQHYSILHSVKSLNSMSVSSLSGDPLTDVATLRESVTKRLDINGIEDLKPGQLVITPSGPNKFKIKLKYQVIKPLVYNMSLLFNFEDNFEVIAGSEN
ncbi:TPA: DUF4845 domain-containing protein [Legionella pneumophila]|uniref:DUF4845 domain-containing protein n=1 Tax=Legionella pneumophila TaxID=446 RepID=A0A2S6EYL6_LEGPN|nr:DUF4845 domain-containing protein [Legionella pneumophila]APF03488.1 DUF4845 domain-containing protein [Legionella pneumophila subsp. fraseri]APF06518.1 DUF4845 domain-containing protein [Legionella pneumophila subsp. fraseri]AUB68973.1 DUF4845 domain-containing protein [Legionella pneumophila]AUB71946.1 DUF4845 domain-containing protein [Legionella pneumophila]KXB26290.1 membrane protein [Legionella pneumophila]